MIFTENFKFEYDDGMVADASFYIPHEIWGKWTPSSVDLIILEEQVELYNEAPLNYTNLNEYFRQYIGFIDSTGQKSIHIIFSNIKKREEFEYKTPAIAHDLDTLFFTIDFHLVDSTFNDLRFY